MSAKSQAEVAELADAHGSGPCTRKGVGVRVPSSAPSFEVPGYARDFKPAGSRFAHLYRSEKPAAFSTNARKFACRGAGGHGASLSSLRRKELCVQVRLVERVPFGFPADVLAVVCRRLLLPLPCRLAGETARSKFGFQRSRTGDAQPFLEEPRGDPYSLG
jgi:hypothetical protein